LKEKDGKILLEDSDIRYAQYLYMNEWTNNGQLGGVETWFKVITELLQKNNYKITRGNKDGQNT